MNPSPNKLSADFICRRSKLFRVESLDKGYSDCLYLSRQIRFSTDGLRIFPTFSTIATILLSGNYPDFSISINILSKLFQHEPHLPHPCDPGTRRRVWLNDPHRYRRPHPARNRPAARSLASTHPAQGGRRPSARTCDLRRRTAAAAPRGKALVRTAQRGVEPNGTATLRSLHPVKHRPEGHSRRKPHRPTRIGSLHPARRNLPNGQSRRHHLFLSIRPRPHSGLSDAASASFEKSEGHDSAHSPDTGDRTVSDRTQSSTSKPVLP